MDAQSIKRAIFDLFRFNQRDFYVQACGTGYLVSSSNPRSSSPLEEYPWRGYRSAYTGTGTPPTDQKFRIRIKPGTVNTLVPSNNSQEFICTPSADTYFYVDATFDSEGNLTAAEIGQGSSIPPDPAGSSDSAPPKGYRGILVVTCDATSIKSIDPLRKTGFDVHPVVVAVDCDSNTLAMQWV